ncbi:hypothetical protein E1B28_011540 [Marasmius oreades]|uniref:SH3 domain-containing protein n=1 Tax=Marasmius oreades TaxID=181124 RepID=A0A9P7RUH7_9AGAR|nr:uncharacterized protein E1B28_011540 [Marasmius oreades]KAG7089907.1 hypothetical protein E1B28_011540 [Marasmius oreades]
MRIHRRVGLVAHTILERVPDKVIQGTPTFDSSGQAVNANASRTGDYAKNTVASSTPPSTIALSVLLAVAVVAFIFGCVFWWIKRRSQRARVSQPISSSPQSTLFGMESQVESVRSDSSSFGGRSVQVEKPEKASMRNYHGVPLVNDLNEKSIVETPPPTYSIANGHRPSKSADAKSSPIPDIPLPPIPPETITVRPPTPPTPPVNGKKPRISPPPLSKPTELPVIPSSQFSLSPTPQAPGSIAEPLPSPARNTSFSHSQRELTSPKTTAEVKMGTGKDGLPLLRLMSVINTFTPSLEDEMLIHIGDTIHMIEEYTDGWCLAQRIGKADAPRGVIPRFCLVERQSQKTSQRNVI